MAFGAGAGRLEITFVDTLRKSKDETVPPRLAMGEAAGLARILQERASKGSHCDR